MRKEFSSNGKERFVLCCSHGTKCPVVEVSEGEVKITDDFRGTVRMSKEQFKELKKISL